MNDRLIIALSILLDDLMSPPSNMGSDINTKLSFRMKDALNIADILIKTEKETRVPSKKKKIIRKRLTK